MLLFMVHSTVCQPFRRRGGGPFGGGGGGGPFGNGGGGGPFFGGGGGGPFGRGGGGGPFGGDGCIDNDGDENNQPSPFPFGPKR
jgi:hypothetical protein